MVIVSKLFPGRVILKQYLNVRYIYKRPDQNIYMSCHESFHTPEQNSQLNCTRKK